MPNNANGDLLIGNGAYPQFTEMTRQGQHWNVQTSTLLAPLTAIPTTTAALEIWNNANNATTFIVDTLFASQILATAATQTYAIYAQVSKPVNAGPSVTAMSVFSQSGRQSFSAAAGAPLVTGIGTTVVANGWRPWGTVQAWGTAAATPGNSWHVDINGKLIVPPGCSLCLHIVGSLATASTFQVGASGVLAGGAGTFALANVA